MNYGLFLDEHNYFEEAFRAYEKGISLFKWPNVYDIWNTYLSKFLERYGGTKLERARDLFEQCLEHCPPNFAKTLYLLYAKLEEEHGMARHAMAVYERATSAVPQEEMFEIFNIYIKRAAEIYGIPKTRQIYEKVFNLICFYFTNLQFLLITNFCVMQCHYFYNFKFTSCFHFLFMTFQNKLSITFKKM